MPESLPPHATIAKRPGPVVLCILDGVGIGSGGDDDAVATARTPNLDHLRATCPTLALRAHGKAVGMPSDSDLGNSEVGHNAMGAGRIFDQGAKLVDDALLGRGTAWSTPVWSKLIAGKTLHLIGLVSDGNVHSHITHLDALIERAAADGVQRLRVHALTDGRDVEARSALRYVGPLQDRLARHTAAGLDYAIASGGGRMLMTMDRYDADWPMVKRGWDCHVLGRGRAFASATQAVEALYAEDPDVDDQYLPAFVVQGSNGTIQDGDAVLFINFRGDRAIEITRAFEQSDFHEFDRERVPDVYYAGMMQYDGDLMLPTNYLVPPPDIDRVVGEFMVANGLRTYAISETQKFGHVTFFFNGNRSGKLSDTLETYVEIPSDNVSFELRPWMKAAQISDAATAAITSGQHDHVRMNYANGDMVGHTGDLEATRIALEVVDRQIGRLHKAVRKADGILLITADHGNADEMFMRKGGTLLTDASGKPQPRTSHTTNQVPLIVFDPRGRLTVRTDVPEPGIANLGATILELCGLTAPSDYLPGLVQETPR